MISYFEAIQLIQETARGMSPWPVEEVPLAQIPGRICGKPVVSPISTPTFRASLVDGFGIDGFGIDRLGREGVLEFQVIGNRAAGDNPNGAPDQSLSTGNLAAWEIMTGAPLPEGCEAVVRVEDVGRPPEKFSGNFPVNIDDSCRRGRVLIQGPVQRGANIRNAGEDFQKGAAVIERGDLLKSHHVMALASLGIGSVAVLRKPRVAILSTGKELVSQNSAQDQICQGGQVWNSTAPFLVAAMSGAGADVIFSQTIGDSPQEFSDCLIRILNNENPDLVVATGGVSMGKHDYVPSAILDLKAEILFHKVKIRPGKPLLFAKLNSRATFFGLPGNPVSTLVGFRFFILSYLRAAMGLRSESTSKAILDTTVVKAKELQCFYKASLEISDRGLRVRLHSGQASFKVQPLLESNGWGILPEGREKFEAGECIEVNFGISEVDDG